MPPDWRRLERAAWLSLGVHLIAGLAMALVLRWGLETNPDLGMRLRFLTERTWLWRAAWGTWNIAALSIIWFFYAFARALPAGLSRAALRIGFAAVALDLSAEAIEMWHLPGLAADALAGQGVGAFHAAHRAAVLLTGFGANGLYTLASVILVWSSRTAFPRWTKIPGWGVGAAGAALSWAAWTGSTAGMFWTNVFLVPCITAWQLGVALTARRRNGLPSSPTHR